MIFGRSSSLERIGVEAFSGQSLLTDPTIVSYNAVTRNDAAMLGLDWNLDK